MYLGFWSERAVRLAVGFVHPAYASLRALRHERADRTDRSAVDAWLVYWFVILVVTSLEPVCDSALAAWAPLYREAKVACVVVLHPQLGNWGFGVYQRHLGPWFDANRNTLEETAGAAVALLCGEGRHNGRLVGVGLRKLFEGVPQTPQTPPTPPVPPLPPHLTVEDAESKEKNL